MATGVRRQSDPGKESHKWAEHRSLQMNRSWRLRWKVNQLLQHIERTREYVSSAQVERTNNTTERIIGSNYKSRAKTTRGFKAWEKILCHCYLSEYLRGTNGMCDLRKVV